MQLNLTGHKHGLSAEETRDLWFQADIDGNGVVDYEEFQVTINLTSLKKGHDSLNKLKMKLLLTLWCYCSREYGTRHGQSCKE